MRANGEHRPEDLVAVGLALLGDVGQQRRLVERPRQIGRATAGDHAGTLPGCAIDDAGDLRAVGKRNQRAEVGVRIGRITHDEFAHQFGHPGDKVVVEVARHDRASGRRAVLSGIDQRTGHRAVHSRIEVGVVENDERGLAAEFQLSAPTVNRGCRHDLSADGGRSGEGHHIDTGVPGQRGARVGAGPGDNVEHPVRQARLGRQAGQRQGRQRGEFGGLDDHRAAGRQRRDHLPDRHLQRVVPRRDGADHTDGLPADRRGVVRGILRGGLALEVAGRAGEERDVVDAAGHVELSRQAHRLAGLADLLGHELGGVGIDEFGQFRQHGGPFSRGRGRPGGQCGPRRGHRHVDIAGCRERHVGDDCAGRRVDHLMMASVGAHRCAIDPATGSNRLGNHRATLTRLIRNSALNRAHNVGIRVSSCL